MSHLTGRQPSLVRRIRNLVHLFVAILAGTTLAGAQTVYTKIMTQGTIIDPNDPNTWPATFNGVPDMGPWAWVDGPTQLQNDPQLANGVFAGQEGANRFFVCRAKLSDGFHPGKYFNGMCNVGWGGVEKVHTSGYELLVNTQPRNAKFLSQTWVSPATAASETFTGGSAGTTRMRVARATYSNGVHAGKEWEGRCNIGWGGKEVPVTPYQVLSLGFDKAAWQAAQTPTQMAEPQLIISGTLTVPTLDPSLIQFDTDSPVVVAYNWTPDDLGRGLTDLANSIPNLLNTMIDQYNAALTDPVKRTARQTMVTALKNGDPETQGIIVVKMIDLARSIVSRPPATWSPEEAGFIKYLQCLGQNQLQKSGVLAEQAFQDWQVKWYQEHGTGMYGLINPAVNPPPEILAMARYGYAVPQDLSPNVAKIIAGTAGAVTATAGAIVMTLTGLGGTIAGLVSSWIAGAAVVGSQGAIAAATATAGIASSTVSGPFIVVTAMVTAGVLKGIEVFQYEEYKTNLAAAIADSKNPVSVGKLMFFLNTEDGQKAVLIWLSVQAATGSS